MKPVRPEISKGSATNEQGFDVSSRTVLGSREVLFLKRGSVRVGRVHRERPCVAACGIRPGRVLWRSSLRADCTALLAPESRRRTHFVRFAHCVQTAAASQFTKRAARADPGAALLVTTECAPAGYRMPLMWRHGVR